MTTPVETLRAYHQRTKHHLDRYAAGPGTLDWDAQPDPFRHWRDTQRIALPRELALTPMHWSELDTEREPAALTLANLSTLLRLSVAITAWKEYAGSRWALRAHPSSGNLHPTETYVFAVGVEGLVDGLYHYQAQDHSLELRASSLPPPGEGPGASEGIRGACSAPDEQFLHAGRNAPCKGREQTLSGVPTLHLGFTSIAWREAWKYGERAFRYCQLDMGHVLGAVSYAAALLGWQPRLLNLDSTQVAAHLGVDRSVDFVGVETEEAECLLTFGAAEVPRFAHWHGHPSLLDPKPLYSWPVIEEVAMATRGFLPSPASGRGWPVGPGEGQSIPRRLSLSPNPSPACGGGGLNAPAVLLQRRSAQAFDGQLVMPREVFNDLLASLLPGCSPCWWLWSAPPQVQVVLMVHRVEGLTPGLYALPRPEEAQMALRASLRANFAWLREDSDLPLYRLIAARADKAARTVSCHQDIASQDSFTVMFLAEFDAALAAGAPVYRSLHWQAGLAGHALTLAAEAAGWRGTGIGCFFDDAVHELLGIADTRWQVVYHYAIGMPVDDARLLTLPAYGGET